MSRQNYPLSDAELARALCNREPGRDDDYNISLDTKISDAPQSQLRRVETLLDESCGAAYGISFREWRDGE